MKIISIETFIFKNKIIEKKAYPLPSFFYDGFIFLKLNTDTGIYGLGEPNPYVDKLLKIKHTLVKIIFPLLKNKEIDKIDLNFIKNKQLKFVNSNLINSCIAALSHSIDDIKGKTKKLPVFKILKEKKSNKKFKVYASGGMIFENQDYNSLIDEALNYKDKKFIGWKFRPKSPNKLLSHAQRIKNPPNFDVKKLINFSEKLRLKVGGKFKLMLDLGCRCKNLNEAKYIVRALSELNFYFIEEPFKRNDIRYNKLKKISKNKIDIAGGEFFSNLKKFKYLSKKKIFNVFQPDSNMLTYREIKNISDLAFKNKIKIIPHNWCNMINQSANINYFSVLDQDEKIIEYNILKNPFEKSFINNSFKITKGCVEQINYAGLGIDVDLKKIKKETIYEKTD